MPRKKQIKIYPKPLKPYQSRTSLVVTIPQEIIKELGIEPEHKFNLSVDVKSKSLIYNIINKYREYTNDGILMIYEKAQYCELISKLKDELNKQLDELESLAQ